MAITARATRWGAAGDFTTAPEISQIFGEIVGLWLAEQWRAMGAPGQVRLVELGPGRGTLMADLLRALRVLPECRAAVSLHLVETGPVLRAAQKATLARFHPDIAPTWHDTLDTVPDGPTLLVANEFFDALPIRQWLRHDGVWHERRIGLADTGGFAFVHGAPGPLPPVPFPADAGDGEIFETCEPGLAIGRTIGTRLARREGAALLADYGHAASACGETLQAVRAHRYAPRAGGSGQRGSDGACRFRRPRHGAAPGRRRDLGTGHPGQLPPRQRRRPARRGAGARQGSGRGFGRPPRRNPLARPGGNGQAVQDAGGVLARLAAPCRMLNGARLSSLPLPVLTDPALAGLDGVRHGFFTREGGG